MKKYKIQSNHLQSGEWQPAFFPPQGVDDVFYSENEFVEERFCTKKEADNFVFNFLINKGVNIDNIEMDGLVHTKFKIGLVNETSVMAIFREVIVDGGVIIFAISGYDLVRMQLVGFDINFDEESDRVLKESIQLLNSNLYFKWDYDRFVSCDPKEIGLNSI